MSEWQQVTIEQIKADDHHAMATGPFGSAISSKFFTEKGIPVIRGGNLSADISVHLSEDGLVFVSPSKAKEFQRSIVRKGDLVFTCWGTINQIGLIDGKGTYPEYVISNKQMKLTPHPEKADPYFLYYLFSSPQMQEWILRSNIGSSVPGFNLGQLKSAEIDLPPLEEQQAITAVLSSLDDKIDLLHRQNKTLEALAQTLFRRWFVDNTNDNWEKHTLEEFVEVMRGVSYKGVGLTEEGEGMPMHNLNSVHEGGGYKYEGIKYYKGEFKERHKVFPGDVIVTNTEQGHELLLIGYPAIVPKCYGEEGIFSQHIFRLNIIDKRITRQFLYYLLMSFDVREQIIGATNGSTVNMLPKDGIEWATFKLPPPELIKQFSEMAQQYWDKKEANYIQIQTLEKLRDALLPRLMSGEVRVSAVPPSYGLEDVPGLFERMGVVEFPYPVPVPMEPAIVPEEKAAYETGLSDAGLCFLETLHQLEQTPSAPIVGKTIAQKTAYVLKDVGVEMGNEFVRANNGPYSADFVKTLDSLELAGFLCQQKHRKGSRFVVVHTEPQYAAQREQFASRLALFKPMIDKTFALVKSLKNTTHAEYVGTVLFVARELEREPGFVAREDVVSQVTDWKPHWFTENRTRKINEAIDFLVEMGFVELV